jgi:hypothetical protein
VLAEEAISGKLDPQTNLRIFCVGENTDVLASRRDKSQDSDEHFVVIVQ